MTEAEGRAKTEQVASLLCFDTSPSRTFSTSGADQQLTWTLVRTLQSEIYHSTGLLQTFQLQLWCWNDKSLSSSPSTMLIQESHVDVPTKHGGDMRKTAPFTYWQAVF